MERPETRPSIESNPSLESVLEELVERDKTFKLQLRSFVTRFNAIKGMVERGAGNKIIEPIVSDGTVIIIAIQKASGIKYSYDEFIALVKSGKVKEILQKK